MPASLANQLQHALVDVFSDSPLITLEQNVDRALEIITRQLDCDGVFVLAAGKTPGRLKTRNLYLKPQFKTQQASREWGLGNMPFFRNLLRHPKLLTLDSIEELPKEAQEEKRFLRQWQVRSLLVLPPLHLGDTHIAVGALQCGGEKRWQEDFVNELSHAAAMIGSAMELTRIALALLASERKYQELFQQFPLACGQLDSSNQLTMMNRIAKQTLVAGDSKDLLALVREDDKGILLDTLAVVRDGVLNQAWCEVGFLHGQELSWQKLSFSRSKADKRTLVLMAEDVSERHRLASELSFHANYDALTGLPNRVHFEALLAKVLGEEQAPPVCIAFVDLDQFRVINNVSGHIAGDRLLCQVAQRLKQLVRKGDVVARLGGDEFGILMHFCNPESAKHIAERICQQLFNHEFNWENRKHGVSASIGIAQLDPAAQDIYTVMGQADAACRLAKERGRNGWLLYDSSDPRLKRLYSEMTASVDVLGALANDRFELYFQEIRPLEATDSGMHLEILLRMYQEEGEMLSPAIFLPAAERYNLASRVDRWVIDHLLLWGNRHLELWQSLSLVSLNLSASSLEDEEFMDWLEMRLLAEPELVDKLCIEITETSVLSQLEQAHRLIELLKPLGCKLAMDDFGAGFSSFAYLKQLAVDYVKIDGQFVLNLCEDKADQAIIAAMCQLGRQMEFQTIAEFVETEAIVAKLQELGVDYAQGYAIGKPRPLLELSESNRSCANAY
ncbi:putative bifunctional diguanylate cyclase/phosphodiesterase [Shewanella algae]|uniref:putative bifunctional diguanylate cyclase/phosphodiesterase n=1 Tax=Shewanella algae TaxID=38313 RepID=UPI0031F47DAE